jgi:beta-barrel assembly-enhancing protease
VRALLGLLSFMATPAIAVPPKPADIAAYQALVAQDLRLATIGYRLASANAPFCANKARNPGWVLHDERQYPDLDMARAAFTFRQPVSISALVPGGPAEHVGMVVGDGPYGIGKDSEIWYGGQPIHHVASIERLENVKTNLAKALAQTPPLPITMTTSSGDRMFGLNPPPICASDFWVDTRSSRDAGADGEAVRVTSGMMAYIEDEAELAAVVAHELSHNLLNHRERLEAAKATKGAARKTRLRIIDTEIEADQLSVWLMTNAGYDPAASVRFWQRYGPTYGSELFTGRAHLKWKQRISLLQNEINRLRQVPVDKGLLSPPLLSLPKS